MTFSVSRRAFVGGSATAGLGFVFAGSGSLDAFTRPTAAATRTATGYGPLIADPKGIVALPKGFSYKLVAQSGVTPTRNGVHPSDPDGMGVFPGSNGGSVLVTNHENSGRESFPVLPVTGVTYDPGATGGTSTIMVDRAGNRVEQYTSLAGTDNNCAGGITPWGTWLTCEETERKAVLGSKLTLNHGYVFEVDPTSQAANEGKSAVPLTFLGRYSHEAVAVDPRTTEIYLTEDASAPNGLYFRWTPPPGFVAGKDALRTLALSPGGATAGRLQAMRCFRGSEHVADLSEATQVGTRYKVEWVDVPDRDAGAVSVRKQFSDGQVTRSRKLEGQWWGDGGAFFVASFARESDGSVNPHDGQVWFYDPRSQTVTLKTIFGVNPDPDADQGNFDGPDNITVSPHGGLILAEDGDGVQHLVGVTSQGKAYALARNDVNGSEFCGPAFSADGTTLFVNIQSPGFTLAITGPWGRPSNADG